MKTARVGCSFCVPAVALLGMLQAPTSAGQDARFDPRTPIATGPDTVAVAAADIDGDGDPDAVVASPSTGTIAWLESNADIDPEFTLSHTVTDTANAPQTLALGDLDGDGDPDLAAAVSANDGRLKWYANDGSLPAGFQEQDLGPTPASDLGQTVNDAVIADLNADGVPDLVAGFWVDAQASIGHVTWYRGTPGPSPTFVPVELPSPPGLIESVESIAIADLDGDGDLDIAAVARPRGAPSAIGLLITWQNSGGLTPSFTPRLIDTSLNQPVGLAIGLLDADDRPDILLVDQADNAAIAYQRLSTAPLTFAQVLTVPLNAPADIELVDLLGDPRPDALIASDDAPLILESNGDPGIGFARIDLASQDGPSTGITASDLDQDGDADIAIAHPGVPVVRWIERVAPIENAFSGDRSPNLDDAGQLAFPGDTLLVPAEQLITRHDIQLPPLPLRIEITGPLTTDPRSNLVATDLLQLATTDSLAFRGAVTIDSLAFVEVDSPGPPLFAAQTTSRVDGTLLIQAGASIETRPAILTRALDGGVVPLQGQPLLLDQPDVVATIMLSDGTLAVAAAGLGPGGIGHPTPAGLAVYTPSATGPDGWLGAAVDDAQIGTHRSLTAGDLDGDGNGDLLTVFTPTATGLPELVANVSDGATPPLFTRTVLDAMPSEGPLLIFDVNRDGLQDIATPLGIYIATAPLTYAYQPFPVPQGVPAFGVGVTDLNGDATPDIVSHIGLIDASSRVVGYQLFALESTGGTNPVFTPTLVESLDRTSDPECLGDCYPSVGLDTRSANTLTLIDLTKDGQDEVVFAEDAGVRVLERVGLGTNFVEIAHAAQPATRWARITPIDAEDDGDTDLAYASPLGSRVGLLETIGTSSYTQRNLDLLRPVERASAVAAADINGDDRIDLAIAAQGFDRVAVFEFQPAADFRVNGPASELTTQGGVQHARGRVTLNGGKLQTINGWTIRDQATLQGTGTVEGDLINLGTVELTDNMFVNGSYMQRDITDPIQTGNLRSELITSTAAAELIVQNDALLAGGFLLDPGPTPPIDQQGPPIRIAHALSFSGSVFDTVALPRIPIQTGQGSALGTLQETYNTGPTGSIFSVGPRFDAGPDLARTEFCAIGTPADGVLFDLTGPANTPDGIVDIAIAYPELDQAPRGGVAVFMGSQGPEGIEFTEVGLYTGKNADNPVAVEAGDFNADGVPEIAFGNKGGARVSNTVHFLSLVADPTDPVVDAQLPPLPFEGDRRITDLTSLPQTQSRTQNRFQRGPAAVSLVVLNSTVLGGVATISTFEPVPGDWESCDIDVCDDPDSVDPIDADGALLTLASGIVGTSRADDKVTVAFNTGGMPDTFPTQVFAVGADPGEVRAADLDADGFPDIATVNETGGSVSILINITDAGSPGGRSFASATDVSLRAAPDDPDPQPRSIAIADLDDDGDLDIAVVSTNDSGVRAVRTLENLLVPNGTLGFATVADLDEQPAGVPLLVREADAEMPGTTTLNDDLVVLVDPGGSSSRGPCIAHELFLSSAFCRADVNRDGQVTDSDFFAWVVAFLNNLPEGDVNGDGFVTDSDFFTWVTLFLQGCP